MRAELVHSIVGLLSAGPHLFDSEGSRPLEFHRSVGHVICTTDRDSTERIRKIRRASRAESRVIENLTLHVVRVRIRSSQISENG